MIPFVMAEQLQPWLELSFSMYTSMYGMVYNNVCYGMAPCTVRSTSNFGLTLSRIYHKVSLQHVALTVVVWLLCVWVQHNRYSLAGNWFGPVCVVPLIFTSSKTSIGL